MPRLALLVVLALAGCKGRSSPDFTASPAPEDGERIARLGTRADFGGTAPATSSSPGVDAQSEAAPMADEDRVAREVAPRGLGTQFGEERPSAVVDGPFTRASGSPDALLSLFYNDLDGVRATAGRLAARGSLESRMTTGDGLLAITLIDDNGRSLPAADIDGRRYVIGNQGQAYRIGVENHS